MCLVQVLGMMAFFTFPALLPTFIDEWQLSNTRAGWINALFFLGYMFAVPVLVSITDRVDPRRIYLICMALTVVSVVGFPLIADGFWTAAMLRTVSGIGLAGTYLPGLKALSDLIEGPAQSRAVSFYTSSFGIGSALSIFFSGKLEAWGGWQTAFLVLSIGPVLALILVWYFLPSRTPTPPVHEHSRLGEFLIVLRNRKAMGYTLAYSVHNFELFGFRSWLVVFLTASQGFQPDGGAGLISPTTFAAIVTLLALPSSVTGNELAVRFGRRRVVCTIMFASALLGSVLGFTANLPFLLVAALTFIYGITVMADSSPITAGTVGEASPGLRGTTMAVHGCVGFLGSFLGPLVFGIVLDLGGGRGNVISWGLAFATMGAVVALGPVFVLLLNRGEKSPGAAPEAPPESAQES